jgi:hypothetical protein
MKVGLVFCIRKTVNLKNPGQTTPLSVSGATNKKENPTQSYSRRLKRLFALQAYFLIQRKYFSCGLSSL